MTEQTPDEQVQSALRVLDGLSTERRLTFLTAVMAAIYTYRAERDPATLVTLADDVAFTVRMHGSAKYRDLLRRSEAAHANSHEENR